MHGCLCEAPGSPESPWKSVLRSPHPDCSHPTPRSPAGQGWQGAEQGVLGPRGSGPYRAAARPAADGAASDGRLLRPHAWRHRNHKPVVYPGRTRWTLRAPLQQLLWRRRKHSLENLWQGFGEMSQRLKALAGLLKNPVQFTAPMYSSQQFLRDLTPSHRHTRKQNTNEPKIKISH